MDVLYEIGKLEKFILTLVTVRFLTFYLFCHWEATIPIRLLCICPSSSSLASHFLHGKTIVSSRTGAEILMWSKNQPDFKPALSCRILTVLSAPKFIELRVKESSLPLSNRLNLSDWLSGRSPESPFSPVIVIKTLASVPLPRSVPEIIGWSRKSFLYTGVLWFL